MTWGEPTPRAGNIDDGGIGSRSKSFRRLVPHCGRRGGLTLIELVLAMLLGTLLLVTLMGVLRRSFAETAWSTSSAAGRHSILMLEEQFRRDIIQSRRVRFSTNSIELIGFNHRDPMTLATTHLPARVVYAVRTHEDGSTALFRTQLATGNTGPGINAMSVTPVWNGAAELSVSTNRLGSLDPRDQDRSWGGLVGMSDEQPMPATLRIVLRDAMGASIWNQTIFHHFGDD